MEGNSAYVTNLVNSIIGVSVLAMPFCFKQCGIILGLCLLFGSAWLTYISCSMLATSAFHKRRRTYEYLALYTLGPTGKFTVELSMIGMMLGTCVAFYVVIGDLSNGILTKFIEGADPQVLRTFTLIFTGLCIALPLGLMKSLSVLSYFGFFSLLFYMAFVVVVILNAIGNGLLKWEWYERIHLWKPSGIFQCLPIFSLAYACQCQLFIVYDSLEEPSVRRIENILSHAIKFVTAVYMMVGFFGYTTYCELITGNLLINFPSNLLLDFIKLGFAMSVVLGFPLIIFPCRQSIHTLFFSKQLESGNPPTEGLAANTYIPPFLFKSITLVIVLSTMIVAIVIPNVETILGLTGATMGSIICFIVPALIYDKASPKGSESISKFVLAVGCLLLVVCTYTNLSNTGQKAVAPVEFPVLPGAAAQVPDVIELDKNAVVDKPVIEEQVKKDPEIGEEIKEQPNAEVIDDEHRHEPPNPIDPAIDENSPDDPGGDSKKEEDVADSKKEEPDMAEQESPKLEEHPKDEESQEHQVENPLVQKEEENEKPKEEQVRKPIVEEEKPAEKDDAADPKDPVKVDKKEEVENLVKREETEQEDKDKEKTDELDGHQKVLLEKIKEQHEKQQQLLIEQEELIKKLEEHQDKQEQDGEAKLPSEKPPKQDAKQPVDKLQQPDNSQREKVEEAPKEGVKGAKNEPVLQGDGIHVLPDEVGVMEEVKMPKVKRDEENAVPKRELLSEQKDDVAASNNEEQNVQQVAPVSQNADGDTKNVDMSENGTEEGDKDKIEVKVDGVEKEGEKIDPEHPRAERSIEDDPLSMVKEEVGEMDKEGIKGDTKLDKKVENVEKVFVDDCRVDDIECWEGKVKSRELKSIDERNRDQT